MPTYSSTIGNGSYQYFTSPVSTGITIPSTEYITAISIALSSSNPKWYNQASGSRSMTFYSRNSNAGSGDNWSGDYDALCTLTMAANSTDYGTTGYKSWTLTKARGEKYSGKTVYFQGWHSSGGQSSIAIYGKFTVTITTAYRYTKVVAGNPIKKTDLSQAATPDDATYIKYRAKFSAGTVCYASTFNSQVLGQ